MGKLNEIRDRLLAGSTTSQLIEEGYAKSSVFNVAKKLKNAQPDIPASPISNELQELRHQRDIIKIQKEIAELEAARDKLPDRVAVLEKTVLDLRSLLKNAVDTALVVGLVYAGMDEKEAKEYTDGWVDRNIKGVPI
ncbi:hypothetical protein ACFLYE_02245 [Chloroflexota bacterium]